MTYFFSDYDNDYDDYEVEELRMQRRWDRQRYNKLARHPDCRDPDHPGCEACCEDDNDES
jgi:hypothetical protein